jgi:hypothetical protein
LDQAHPPPAGFITRAQAEARLAAILAGDDALVVVDAPAAVVTFKAACDEWLRYVEHDKRRAKSTVRDYRNGVGCYLLGALGADTLRDGHHDALR